MATKGLVAIVGRPNVGKSTLFNRLIGERRAIVEDEPGTTRDRIYGECEWNGRIFTVVDTGGLELASDDNITSQIAAQVRLAIEEADVIIFLVDVKAGITEADREVADLLRRAQKPIVLGANKAEGPVRRQEALEFYELGLGEPLTLTAISGTGTGDVLDAVTEHLPPPPTEEEDDPYAGVPRIAIVGRPNVGKSSLVNALLGHERVIVSDVPGTTRDTIDTLVTYNGRRYLLIDTAGIRRRGRIGPGVEKYSVLRADRAIDRCDVAVLMLDGVAGIAAQDTHIAGFVDEAAKGIVIVLNKWDLVRERLREAERRAQPDLIVPVEPRKRRSEAEIEQNDAKQYQRIVRDRLNFVSYAPLVFASAKTHYHVGQILDHAQAIYETRHQRVPTPRLNEVMREAIARHKPAAVQGRPLRLYYVTQPEVNPPTFVFFVNDPDLLHFSYRRYLENRLREEFGFAGTAIRLEFRARTSVTLDDEGRRTRRGANPARRAR